jgi:radical SAM-linked protein
MLSTKKKISSRTRYRVRVGRLGEASRLTHLAQIESLRRSVLASGLPAVLDGRRKRPRPRLAFGPAIALGYESLAEYFDLELESRVAPEEVAEVLSRSLAKGFSIRGVRRIPKFFPSIDASVNVVRYSLRSEYPENASELRGRLLARSEIVIEKVKDGGARVERVDARPLILKLDLTGPRNADLTLRFGPKRTVKPEAIVREWLGAVPEDLRVLREDLFSETSRGELISP